MRVTQGTFSYLPDFTDAQIKAQVQYCLDNDWPILIEYTDDPHPRNILWEMWGMPRQYCTCALICASVKSGR